MNVEQHAEKYPEIWKRFSPRETLIRYLWYLGIVFLAIWSLHTLEIPRFYFLDAHEQAGDLLGRMLPPYWEFTRKVMDPLLETIHIATLGTATTGQHSSGRASNAGARRQRPRPGGTGG